MTPVQQRINASSGAGTPDDAVHLLLSAGDVKMTVDSPEQVMEEIQLRATQVGSVLEGIFQNPHGHLDWGIND
jgi:hypothetical protein